MVHFCSLHGLHNICYDTLLTKNDNGLVKTKYADNMHTTVKSYPRFSYTNLSKKGNF